MITYQILNDTNAYKISLAWFRKPLREQQEILGDDPWPYCLEKNRRTVETLIGYPFEQGMINERLPLEELFASNTHHL